MTHIHYKWYRYDYNYDGDDIRVGLREFIVKRETPKGVWLQELPVFWNSDKLPYSDHFKYADEHFVLKDARKRYAYPTVALAKESFIIRKAWEALYCSKQLQRAKAARYLVENDLTEGHLSDIEVSIFIRALSTLKGEFDDVSED